MSEKISYQIPLIEINKKIAELKGIEGTCDAMGVLTCKDKICLTASDGTTQNLFIYKNWAEDINDAWRLFEELPNGYTITKTNSEYKVFNWDSDSDQWDSARAETAQLAICLTWIKWKGV